MRTVWAAAELQIKRHAPKMRFIKNELHLENNHKYGFHSNCRIENHILKH